MSFSLSGQQRKKLQSALIDAFPTLASLEQMLSFELNKKLRAIAGEGSLKDIIFKLIKTAEAEGQVEDLVRAARNSNPGNSLLEAIAIELLSPETSSISKPSPADIATTTTKPSTQQRKIQIGCIIVVLGATLFSVTLFTYTFEKVLHIKIPREIPQKPQKKSPYKEL